MSVLLASQEVAMRKAAAHFAHSTITCDYALFHVLASSLHSLSLTSRQAHLERLCRGSGHCGVVMCVVCLE
jgi:hypothetical protein